MLTDKLEHVEQPAPIPNDLPQVHDLVAADIAARKQIGIVRYGRALQPFNGRDGLRDLYEELLDACCYIRQLMYERDQQITLNADSDAVEQLAAAVVASKKNRLRQHMAVEHDFGDEIAASMADKGDLVQEHLHEHRNPDCGHDYQPWGSP